MRRLKWAVVVCVIAVAGIAALGHSCLGSKHAQPKTPSASELDRDHGRHSSTGLRQLVRSSIHGRVFDAGHVAIPHARVCAFIGGDRALPRSETLDPRCATASAHTTTAHFNRRITAP